MTTPLDTAVTIDLLAGARDPDGDRLTLVSASPSLGSLERLPDGRSVHVTPLTGSTEPITIRYIVDDGHAHPVTGSMVVIIDGNHAPVALAGEYMVAENGSIDLFLNGSDADYDLLTFTIVTPPQRGTLEGQAPQLRYKPNTGFSGADTLTYSVSDGRSPPVVSTVTFTVKRANRAPVAVSRSATGAEDTSQAITVAATDEDGDALTFALNTFPAHGQVFNIGAEFTYIPFANYHGPDSFTFAVNDSVFARSIGTVSITVSSVDDTPTADNLQRSVNEDGTTSITLSGFDLEREPLSFAIATGPAHGTVSGTPPNVTYTPAANFNGTDSFTYTAGAGAGTSAPATVTLFVAAVNDAPAVLDVGVTTAEDTAVDFTLQASDVDGQTLAYALVTLPADGVVTGSGESRRYTPAANATGTRTFAYQASDGSRFATAVVTVAITPVNDPPSAVDDYVATDAGAPLTVTLASNDSDVDGDAVTVTSLGAAAHGEVELVDGKLRYTPEAGFTGVDELEYTIEDPLGLSSTALVHVGVGAFPPGAPIETVLALAVDTNDRRNAPSLSNDGRVIAFTTMNALVADDTGGLLDIYVYDRGDRSLTRVSKTSAGVQANGASRNAHVSASGRFVVFESIANNLVAGDTNAAFDVFRHDRVTGETVRVSVATGGGQGTGASVEGRVSDDGNLVVFGSGAFDLVANDANGAVDIFVRNLAAGTTTRVSASVNGGDADLASTDAVIGGDGRFVAFASSATNLVAGDANLVSDVFVRDLAAGTTARVSISSTGIEANGLSSGPSLSRDGRFVSFLSAATNLVAGGTSTRVYVHDRQAVTTTRPVPTTSVWARLSGDGRYLAFLDATFSGTVSICDRFTAVTATPTGATGWRWPTFSRDGRYVAVITAASGGTLVVAPNPL
ncbi:MAG: tandem-95 repeat protein [Myxococcales bacterium]|nr:tandem-95 repeat protein [Myxococcales bacterium]